MPTPSPTSQREQQQQHQPHPAHHVLPRGDLARLCHAAADAAQEENRREKWGNARWSNRIWPLIATTACGHRMAHRKWKETKQQPSPLPGPPVPGSSLVSFHFLWAILCPQAVKFRISFLSLSFSGSISKSVIIGYYDKVRKWLKCHNKLFFKIFERFTAVMDQ